MTGPAAWKAANGAALPDPGGSIRADDVTDRASFVALEEEWNQLVDATRSEPFHRHEFVRIWLDNFAAGEPLRICTLRDGRGALTAALPLLRRSGKILGFPVRTLAGTANVHSCRFDLVASDPQAAGEAFYDHLSADPGWDVIQLPDVPDDGSAWHFYRAAQRAGNPVGAWESMRSPYVPLPASMEEMESQLPSKFRSNLRRRRRKLEQAGDLILERVDGGIDLERKLEEGFLLEKSGWKGRKGTAISQDLRTRGFYSELARAASQRGYLSLYLTRQLGEPIAFHYGLSSLGKYYLLKPGYSEQLSECSPGQLLVHQVLRDCITRGIKEFDFLGPDMTWKQDWTDKKRRHTWLFVFRNSPLGRTLCKAKFKWVPAGAKVLHRWIH